MTAAQKEILESIRDIIGNNNTDSGAQTENEEEVLELTEVIEENSATTENIKETMPAKKSSKKQEIELEELAPAEEADVLSEIDALLAADAGSAAAEPITRDDVEIELSDVVKPRTSVKAEIEPEVPDFAGETNMETENTEQLISEQSAALAQAALKNLVKTAEEVTRPKVQSAPFRNGDTVEDLVLDMLKPILKDWIDANLPKLVQTIVEKEIKKLIPKE